MTNKNHILQESKIGKFTMTHPMGGTRVYNINEDGNHTVRDFDENGKRREFPGWKLELVGSIEFAQSHWNSSLKHGFEFAND